MINATKTQAAERKGGTSTAAPLGPSAAQGRLVSLDALRGFDMFWILGADRIVGRLDHVLGERGMFHALAGQMDHVEWAGFRFYDLIFPLFVFLAGVSIHLSLGKLIASQGRLAAYGRILRRGALLFVVGLIYYGGLSHPWPEMRVMGVLQRIALCYMGAGLLYCHLRARGLLVACGLLLAGYWALMSFVPAPGQAAVSFAPGQNLANWIDAHYLPGWLYDKTFDPEGLLSTLPAIGSCLLGVLAGMLLLGKRLSPGRKAAWLIGGGLGLVVLGQLWGLQFPVVKKLWTSSFVLVAGGWSAALLGLFYLVIDVWQARAWARPFVWIGSNALALYVFTSLFDFSGLAARLVGGEDHLVFGRWTLVLGATVAMGLILLLARWLYRRQIFIRL